MKILIVGDTDIDGTGAAAIIGWYYQCKYNILQRKVMNLEINTLFPERGKLNEIFADEEWVQSQYNYYDRIYLCDTGLDSEKGNHNLGEILAPKTVYFDHHETNFNNQEKYAGNFKGFHVKEGARCTAKIAFDVLLKEFETPPDKLHPILTRKYSKFLQVKEFAHLVNDIDMWIRKYPRSTELADVVTEVGPYRAFKEFEKIRLNPQQDTETTRAAVERAKQQKAKSLELGEATLVKHRNYKVPFYTAVVNGYQAEVASDLVHAKGMIAVFNIPTQQ